MGDDLRVLRLSHAEPLGTIALPMRDHISADAHVSVLRTDMRWVERPINFLYVQGSNLPMQRNRCVQLMDGEWLLFIDDDMVFEPDAVRRLVESYRELKDHISGPIMVGGLCVRRYPPYQPTLYRARDMKHGPFNVIEDWEDQDYVEVDATGTAFLLIEKEVFSAVMGGPFPSLEDRLALPPWPFFEWYADMDAEEWHGGMGEDTRFCLRARAAGCRIYVDTRIQIGHVGERVFDIRDFYRTVASRSSAQAEAHRTLNDSIGLRTLSPEEARRREGV